MENTSAVPTIERRHQGDRRKETREVPEDRRAQDWRRAADRHARAHQGPTPESTVALFFRNEAARIEDETR
jgi:hypothetical protein